MGYGRLNLKDNPKRNEAYYCRCCEVWHDPFGLSHKATEVVELIKYNICEECKKTKGNLFEKDKP